MKDIFNKKKYIFWQKASLPITDLLNLLVFRPKVTYPDDLSIPNGTMVISNHQHRYDPYLIYYYLNKINKRNDDETLIRFPVASPYMRHWALGPFLKFFGCFDIGNSVREKVNGLLLIRSLLDSEISILLFPEGRRVKIDEKPFDFHKGIDSILSGDTDVLLILITGMNDFEWLNFSFKSQVTVKFSKLITADLPQKEKNKFVGNFYNKKGDSD